MDLEGVSGYRVRANDLNFDCRDLRMLIQRAGVRAMDGGDDFAKVRRQSTANRQGCGSACVHS